MSPAALCTGKPPSDRRVSTAVGIHLPQPADVFEAARYLQADPRIHIGNADYGDNRSGDFENRPG